MHSWLGLLRQCLSFTTTCRTPKVRACSSLYQSLIVAPASVMQPCAGSKARSTSLSLKATLVLGWLASLKGYPRAQVGQAGVMVGVGAAVGVRVAVGADVAVRVGV